jgi:hypothetical protein
MGISQPRVVAIEQARNVTIDVLERYIKAVGHRLEVNAVKGKSRVPLVAVRQRRATSASRSKSGSTSRAARTRKGVAAARRAAG